MKNKSCPSCGNTFSCYADSGLSCWCEKYHLAPDTLEDLQNKFDGCLCEICLSKIAVEDENNDKECLES